MSKAYGILAPKPRKPIPLMKELRSAARNAQLSAPAWAALMIQAEMCIGKLLFPKDD